jgi:LmbE family N-acetylglucosaminyl deacetylase
VNQQKLLLVFPHPDDESFTTGGTIAKYIDAGWDIQLQVMTRGSAGMRGEYGDDVDLGEVRTQEVTDACRVLGLSNVQVLEYQDGGLMKINPGELEDVLYKMFLSVDPDVIITFEPNGISNHPDHKKLCISVTFAFQKYARFRANGEKLGSRDPRRKFVSHLPKSERPEPKLYYTCIPQSVVDFLQKNDVIPSESFGKPWTGIPDKMITTSIDVSDYTEKKLMALSKHKTQIADVKRFVSIDNQPLMYKEYFVLRMQGQQEIFMGKDDVVSGDL